MKEKGSKRTSVLWKWFKPVGGNHAMCGICKQRLSYLSSISNLRKHLSRKHAGIYKATFQDCNSVTDSSEGITHIITEEGIIESNEVSTIDDLNGTLDLADVETLDLNSAVGATIYGNMRNNTPEKSSRMSQPGIRNKTRPCYEDNNFNSDNHREHEFETFGKIIGYQMKQLPLEAAFEVQMKIHDLLMQERIKALKSSTSE